MANILMKSGEIREVSSEKMLSFLEDNRDLIQTRHSARRRPVKKEENTEIQLTSKK
ncbi:MAG: hypothetical protein ACKO2V_16970 [Snowella sp.]